MIRHICRALMTGAFIYSGIEAVRRPVARPDAESALPGMAPADSAKVVAGSGAVQIVGGGMLLWDKAPRTTSTVLAASLVPTTLSDDRFWEAPKGERAAKLRQFLTNAALFGGLVITAMDTQGKPGISWRASHAVDHAGAVADYKRREAVLLAQLARQKALTAAAEGKAKVIDLRADTVVPVQRAVKDARIGLSVAGKTGKALAKTAQMATKGGKALVSAVTPG